MVGCERCNWTGTSHSVGADGIESATCSCSTPETMRIWADGHQWTFAADGSPSAETNHGGWVAAVRPSDGALLTSGPNMGTNVPREVLVELDRRAAWEVTGGQDVTD